MLVGCRPGDSGSNAAGDKQPGSDQPPAQAISALDLCAELRKNKDVAEAKYKGRILEVSGVVRRRTASGFMHTPMVFLDGQGSPSTTSELTEVECFFAPEDVFKALAVLPGQTVKIRGRYQGRTAAYLKEAAVVEAGPLPAVEYTLAEYRRKLGPDPAKALSGDRKPIILKGTLSAVEPPKPGDRKWTFTAEDTSPAAEPPLKVRFEVWTVDAPTLMDFVRTLKPGSPFRVYGLPNLFDGPVKLSEETLLPE